MHTLRTQSQAAAAASSSVRPDSAQAVPTHVSGQADSRSSIMHTRPHRAAHRVEADSVVAPGRPRPVRHCATHQALARAPCAPSTSAHTRTRADQRAHCAPRAQPVSQRHVLHAPRHSVGRYSAARGGSWHTAISGRRVAGVAGRAQITALLCPATQLCAALLWWPTQVLYAALLGARRGGAGLAHSMRQRATGRLVTGAVAGRGCIPSVACTLTSRLVPGTAGGAASSALAAHVRAWTVSTARAVRHFAAVHTPAATAHTPATAATRCAGYLTC